MPQPKNRQEARLQELIAQANAMNVQVRKEKLLREAGYRVHSGRCRIDGRETIIIDRDTPIADQIEFLSGELAEWQKPPVTTSDCAEVAGAPAVEISARGFFSPPRCRRQTAGRPP
ncbi:MAG: hypothetical protein FJ143_18640 [Deltaproteobacteria bacterium]|nr:hypothetical protein [Deltaproteobacteria bacterium]